MKRARILIEMRLPGPVDGLLLLRNSSRRSEMQTALTKFRKPGWLLTAVLLISVLIVSIFWMVLPARFRATENTDYVYYYEPVARNILKGQGVVSSDGSPAIRYPPGYPLLLTSI